jgi:hypothetical protein
VAEEEQERDLPVQAVRLVHALETAEERLDGTETRTEDEVEREGRRAGEREQDGDARQGEVAALEADVELLRECPEDERSRAQRDQQERLAKGDQLVGGEAHLRSPVPRRYVSLRMVARDDTSRSAGNVQTAWPLP